MSGMSRPVRLSSSQQEVSSASLTHRSYAAISATHSSPVCWPVDRSCGRNFLRRSKTPSRHIRGRTSAEPDLPTSLRTTNAPRLFTIDKYAMPDFKVKQPPDPVAVIAKFGPMLGKDSLDHRGPEQSAFGAAGCEQHALKLVQLRPLQPMLPGRRKAHLLPVDD